MVGDLSHRVEVELSGDQRRQLIGRVGVRVRVMTRRPICSRCLLSGDRLSSEEMRVIGSGAARMTSDVQSGPRGEPGQDRSDPVVEARRHVVRSSRRSEPDQVRVRVERRFVNR